MTDSQSENCYTFTRKMPAGWWAMFVGFFLSMLITGFVVLETFIFKYVGVLYLTGVMCAVAVLLPLVIRGTIKFTSTSIVVDFRWRHQTYSWADVKRLKPGLINIVIELKNSKPRTWKQIFLYGMSDKVLVPFEEFENIRPLIPDYVTLNPDLKKGSKGKKIPLKLLITVMIISLLQIFVWILVCRTILMPVNIFIGNMVFGVIGVSAVIFIIQPLIQCIERYLPKIRNLSTDIFLNFCNCTFILCFIVMITGWCGLAFAAYLLAVAYIGLSISLWMLLVLISQKIKGVMPWTAFLITAVIFIKYPGKILLWEYQHVKTYSVGIEKEVNRKIFQFRSIEEEYFNAVRKKVADFIAVWPDGRKAVCLSAVGSSKAKRKTKLYYYSSDMKLVCVCSIPGTGYLLSRQGELICWAGKNKQGKRGLFSQKFGKEELRFIPGKSFPAVYIPADDSYRRVRYQECFDDDKKDCRVMEYDWDEKTSTELFSGPNIHDLTFIKNDKCGYTSRSETECSVMIWKRNSGSRKLYSMTVSENDSRCQNRMVLSPWLTYAAVYNTERKTFDIVSLKTQDLVASLPTESDTIVWGKKHFFVQGSVYKFTDAGAIQKLDIDMPKLKEVSFSPKSNFMIGNVDRFPEYVVLVDLKNGNVRKIVSCSYIGFMGFQKYSSLCNWDKTGFHFVPYIFITKNPRLICIEPGMENAK